MKVTIMYKGISVLSLFDGISCGQVALNQADIPIIDYFASEIDKKAIEVTSSNYPDTIQLGDVSSLKSDRLPKIDLLIGGSPCQGFSKNGRQLNFHDPRSRLFFEYVRLLQDLEPRYFLLENVPMRLEYQNIISRYLKVQPILVNSSHFSVQYRPRLYWTNLKVDRIPPISPLTLKDIVQDQILPSSLREDWVFIRKKGHITSSCNGIIYLGGVCRLSKPKKSNFSQGNRVYSEQGKSIALSATSGGLGSKTGLYMIGETIRKLSRLECERLQTVPDNYTRVVSEAQALKLLGNAWTVQVITHILKKIRTCKI